MGFHFFYSLLADNEAGQVRFLEEPVVRVLLLGTHAKSLILQSVVAPGLLYYVFPLVEQGHMPQDFMLQGFFHEFDTKDILYLNSVPLPPIFATDRYINVASHLSFFHVRFRYLKSSKNIYLENFLLQQILKFLDSELPILRVVYLWICNNLKQWHTHSIVVNQSVILEVMKAFC